MYREPQMIGAAAGYGNNVAAAASDKCEARQSEVNEEMDRLSRSIDHLGMTANQLADRLVTVRRQTGTVAGKGESAPEPVLCPLADSIRCQRKQLDSFNVTLMAVLGELEV